jgi:hypothetical protein
MLKRQWQFATLFLSSTERPSKSELPLLLQFHSNLINPYTQVYSLKNIMFKYNVAISTKAALCELLDANLFVIVSSYFSLNQLLRWLVRSSGCHKSRIQHGFSDRIVIGSLHLIQCGVLVGTCGASLD